MNKPLLPVVLAGLLALAVARCDAADDTTAYTAMRIMGKALGDESISRVVEVTGRAGKPQPSAWRIVILDGAKGTREVTVSGGQVVSQKKAGSTVLKPIRLTDLNLDSSGAFEAADAQARKAHVPFAAIDYALRVSATTGKPVWELALSDAGHAHVGEVRLAAHDGTLIAINGLTAGQQTASSTPRPLVSSHDPDHDSVRPTRVTPTGRETTTSTTTTTTYSTVRPAPTPDEDDDRRPRGDLPSNEGGFFSRAGRTLDHTTDAVGDTVGRTGEAVGRTMRRTGVKLQRFFTGSGSDNNGGSHD